MQELEKILEEINKQKRICLEIDNGDEYNAGALDMANSIKYIIRKHTNDDKCAECSRRKWYQQGYEDGKNNNDGWIPVERGLPEVIRTPEEDDEYPEFNVTIRGAEKATTLKYSPADHTWFDDNGYVYDVIAWRPMPEVYRPADKTERSET